MDRPTNSRHVAPANLSRADVASRGPLPRVVSERRRDRPTTGLRPSLSAKTGSLKRVGLCRRPVRLPESSATGARPAHDIFTDDPDANAAASREAEDRRVWCVRADDAEAATAWTPATGGSEAHRRRAQPGETRAGPPRCATRSSTACATAASRPAPPGPQPGRGPGRRRPRRPRADHRPRPAAARRGRRRRRRPARPPLPARRTPAARRGHRRREDPVRPVHGPGGHQQRADRARQGRQVRRPAQGRGPVRVRPRQRGAPGARRGRHPLHGRPRHLQPISVPGAAGIPVTHRGVAHEFTSSAAMSPPTTNARSWTGLRSPSCAAPSWS